MSQDVMMSDSICVKVFSMMSSMALINSAHYWRPRASKATAPHPSTLAWKIQWTEEPGGLQSVGLQESDTT